MCVTLGWGVGEGVSGEYGGLMGDGEAEGRGKGKREGRKVRGERGEEGKKRQGSFCTM